MLSGTTSNSTSKPSQSLLLLQLVETCLHTGSDEEVIDCVKNILETETGSQLSCNFLTCVASIMGAVETCLHAGSTEEVIECIINILTSIGQGDCMACICDVIPCNDKRSELTEAKFLNRSEAEALDVTSWTWKNLAESVLCSDGSAAKITDAEHTMLPDNHFFVLVTKPGWGYSNWEHSDGEHFEDRSKCGHDMWVWTSAPPISPACSTTEVRWANYIINEAVRLHSHPEDIRKAISTGVSTFLLIITRLHVQVWRG